MRRQEKGITDRAAIEDILHRATVCRLGLCADDQPYVVPLSFGYVEGRLYIHSAGEGKKIALLQRNNRVCFEVDLDEELVRGPHSCNWGMRYRSVIGTGRATFVQEAEAKRAALNTIMAHYGGPQDDYTPQALAGVTVIRVDIEEMTGKQGGYARS
jgi:hypothetical protein